MDPSEEVNAADGTYIVVPNKKTPPYTELILQSIREANEKNKGTTVQNMKKLILAKHESLNAKTFKTHFKKAFTKVLEDNKIERVVAKNPEKKETTGMHGRFRLKAEYVKEEKEKEKIKVKKLKEKAKEAAAAAKKDEAKSTQAKSLSQKVAKERLKKARKSLSSKTAGAMTPRKKQPVKRTAKVKENGAKQATKRKTAPKKGASPAVKETVAKKKQSAASKKTSKAKSTDTPKKAKKSAGRPKKTAAKQ